ncbi:hypothetical protein D3C85_1807750 [compost metagenome]
MVLDGDGKPVSITHGTVAGNIVEIKAPSAQLTNPAYSEQDNVAMLELDMNVNPGVAGNDELEIIVR